MSPIESVQVHFQRIDDVLFGSWIQNEKKEAVRNHGLIEELASVKKWILRIALYGSISVGVLVLHALGVPTQLIWSAVSSLVGHIGFF
jgi:hypothetical protein